MGFSIKEALGQNARILRARASRPAIVGTLVAMGAVVVATLGVCLTGHGEITLHAIVAAQSENLVLWTLDAMPFVFAFLGQYSNYVVANEASMLVVEQTNELRMLAAQLEKEARFAATHDALTELPNRALFHDRMERAIAAGGAQPGTLAVLLLDIDNIKEIQDTLGPASTDSLIRQLAVRLVGWAKSDDSVARVDGNMFAILLGGQARKAEAEKAAHHLQKALEPPFAVHNLKLSLHTSIGIALFPEHGEDPDTLVQRAGVALFVAAKSHNGYAVYSPALDDHSPRRLTLMAELRRALERSELDLYYQPKVNIGLGHVIGAEALVRWNHPQHGITPPSEFIDLAERTRLIRPLTQWVMERAFLDCATLRAEGLALTISINLSAKDLHDPELPDRIAGVMAKTRVDPGWIIFEITESSIMTDPLRVLNVVERIHGMGFSLSIDDFGTGYSSLAYLKKLPVSELKIDKSFITDMMASENDAVIVRTTIDLAHNLGLKVTAEGVEDSAVIEALRGYGCDIAQGFLIAEPLPLGEFVPWLAASPWK